MDGFEKMTFKQFVENCEALKSQYAEVLLPFFNVQMVRCFYPEKLVRKAALNEKKEDVNNG